MLSFFDICTRWVVAAVMKEIRSSRARAALEMLSAGLDAVASLAYLNAANQALLREHGACKGALQTEKSPLSVPVRSFSVLASA